MSPKTIRLVPKEPHLYGATLAQGHLAEFARELDEAASTPTMLCVDFSNTISVSGSYLRATCLWAILCGQAHVNGHSSTPNADTWGVRSLALFPVVYNCNEDIRGELDDFFKSRALPIILKKLSSSDSVDEGHLLGSLDSTLFATLRLLATLQEATAKQISEKSGEQITVNGWSNRLSDLYMLRLVSRRREGKFWFYKSIAKNISIWA